MPHRDPFLGQLKIMRRLNDYAELAKMRVTTLIALTPVDDGVAKTDARAPVVFRCSSFYVLALFGSMSDSTQR